MIGLVSNVFDHVNLSAWMQFDFIPVTGMGTSTNANATWASLAAIIAAATSFIIDDTLSGDVNVEPTLRLPVLHCSAKQLVSRLFPTDITRCNDSILERLNTASSNARLKFPQILLIPLLQMPLNVTRCLLSSHFVTRLEMMTTVC